MRFRNDELTELLNYLNDESPPLAVIAVLHFIDENKEFANPLEYLGDSMRIEWMREQDLGSTPLPLFCVISSHFFFD